MPRNKRNKPDPSLTYLAADSVVTGDGGVVRVGDRLRGDHPLLLATWGDGALWAPDGSDSAELGRRRVALAAAGEEASRRSYEFQALPAPPRPIPDEDAVIAIRATGHVLGDAASADGRSLFVDKGTRIARGDPLVKADPDSFREVVPPELKGKRDRALVALVDMEEQRADGTTRKVWGGTWVPRDHPFTKIHPLMFKLPPPELD
jgi:hypothetical protein